ncbi:ABC transporter ATP-binding protein [Rubrobacter aplysinae]|uniref:ABC transporter ATP-binding protein n=1 Tax=Rubrobacter aplysinae TaxID=909625 RepID=UPI0009FC91B6|nr:ABC transporter ATP-binding protein [Rubrobacter aplysinae]
MAEETENNSLLVETEGLTKRYGKGITAVDGLDLVVGRGEVYGFLGPNGAGKTTTLRMLLGLITPSSGRATVAGYSPGSPSGLAKVGSLVESPAFYPYLSGRDNLKVIARYCGAPESRIAGALDTVELSERAKDKYRKYSLGMKQRLGVAAALLKDPELLILDEPTNGLDPKGMADMRTLIRGLGTGERTVLLSSHMLGEVEQICDRVGVISEGELVREGTVQELRGGSELLVRARQPAKAREIARGLPGVESISEGPGGDGSLRISASHAEDGDDATADIERWAASINARLVGSGVEVSELRSVEQSLEDVFLELTGQPAEGPAGDSAESPDDRETAGESTASTAPAESATSTNKEEG